MKSHQHKKVKPARGTNSPAPRLVRKPLVHAVAVSLLLTANATPAATIAVDTDSDTATGQCRLRDAIVAANSDSTVEGCDTGSGSDLIDLAAISGQTIILNGTSLPTFSSEITVSGNDVTIDGNYLSRLMYSYYADLTLTNMTLTGANDPGDSYNFGAGALVSYFGSLNLDTVTLSLNQSIGVFSALQPLTIDNSVFNSNSEQGLVGLYNDTATITNSTFTNNGQDGLVAALGGVSGDGKGFNTSNSQFTGNTAAGMVSIATFGDVSNSTISGNGGAGLVAGFINRTEIITLSNSVVSGNTQGGVRIDDYGTAIIQNSTLSGNTHAGVELRDNNATLTLVNSTIVNTTVTGSGGGIFASANSSVDSLRVTLTNSIVANTIGGTDCFDADGDSFKPLGLNGTNIVETIGNCTTTGAGSAITGVDPELGPLADNGGPTFSHLPGLSSPARDSGDNAFVTFPYDQRGPGFERIYAAGTVDIGAIELQESITIGPDFRVNTLNDTRDGTCDESPGDCSLADAIVASNSDADASTITFHNSLLGPPGTITLGGTELPIITTGISIEGSGLTINANSLSRIVSTGAGADLSIDQLTMINGAAEPNSLAAGLGGALNVNGGAVTLSNCTLSGNTAASPGTGGAIRVENSSLNIVDCTISDNSAQSYGGGISIIGGTLTITSSTISGNNAEVWGGGIYASATSVAIDNTTMAYNTAGINGGGLHADTNAEIGIINSTLSSNSAVAGLSLNLRNNVSLSLNNSIIYSGLGSADCNQLLTASTINLQGANLIGDIGNCTPGAGTVLTDDPLLGLLQDNGGVTFTMLPGATGPSPAANAGDNTTVPGGLASDQRGQPRINGTNVDLGAVELQAGQLALSPAMKSVDEDAGIAILNVTRTDGSEGALRVRMFTGDDSATAPEDYSAVDGFVNFDNGSSLSQSVALTIVDDNLLEADEVFNVFLSDPTGGASLGVDSAIVEILNEDAPNPGVLSISPLMQTVDEDAGTAMLTVTRSAGFNGIVSVQLNTQDGTAQEGSDFIDISDLKVEFADNDMADKQILVSLTDDDEVEANEDFTVEISAPAGGAQLGDFIATVTIDSEDVAGEEIFGDGFEETEPN